MGADRTLMQVKVRCGLGRVGLLGRLYGNSRGMSAPDQSPHFDRSPLTSGLPPETDLLRAGRHVSKVPNPDIATASLDHLIGTSKQRTGIAWQKRRLPSG